MFRFISLYYHIIECVILCQIHASINILKVSCSKFFDIFLLPFFSPLTATWRQFGINNLALVHIGFIPVQCIVPVGVICHTTASRLYGAKEINEWLVEFFIMKSCSESYDKWQVVCSGRSCKQHWFTVWCESTSNVLLKMC